MGRWRSLRPARALELVLVLLAGCTGPPVTTSEVVTLGQPPEPGPAEQQLVDLLDAHPELGGFAQGPDPTVGDPRRWFATAGPPGTMTVDFHVAWDCGSGRCRAEHVWHFSQPSGAELRLVAETGADDPPLVRHDGAETGSVLVAILARRCPGCASERVAGSVQIEGRNAGGGGPMVADRDVSFDDLPVGPYVAWFVPEGCAEAAPASVVFSIAAGTQTYVHLELVGSAASHACRPAT